MDEPAETLVRMRQAVLLWDMDNMCARARDLRSLVSFLSLCVDAEAPRVAAARRPIYRRRKALMAQYGVEMISGGVVKSGADRQLCEYASKLGREGHRRFVVVSNDGYFTRLARIGEVHVISMDPSRASARLVAAASSVTTLAHDGTRWRLTREAGWMPNRGNGESSG